jgi:hypothetical protein
MSGKTGQSFETIQKCQTSPSPNESVSSHVTVKKMKKSMLGWIILGLAGLGILFSLISFGWILGSQSAMTSEVVASPSNPATSPVAFSQLATQLVVEGDDTLARALRAEITRQAKSETALGQINLGSAQDVAAQSPLLVVRLKQHSGFWTPVYARTTLQVEAAYASNGDVSFRENEPTQFHSAGDQPVRQYEGHYQLTDSSWGVMSLPGYRDYLAHQVAVTLLTSMQEQLKP